MSSRDLNPAPIRYRRRPWAQGVDLRSNPEASVTTSVRRSTLPVDPNAPVLSAAASRRTPSLLLLRVVADLAFVQSRRPGAHARHAGEGEECAVKFNFDEVSGVGLISGDDGQRYEFNVSDVQAGAPAAAAADFVAIENLATQIMILAAAPQPAADLSATNASGEAIDWQNSSSASTAASGAAISASASPG